MGSSPIVSTGAVGLDRRQSVARPALVYHRAMSSSRALSRHSWAVVKQNRYLLAFPFVGFLVMLIPLAVVVVVVAMVVSADTADDQLPWPVIIVAILGLFVAVLVANVFNAGLVRAVSDELRGVDSSFGRGLSGAMRRFGAVFSWSVVQTTVSLILSRLQGEGGGVAGIFRSIAAATAGLAWSVVTFLVMPVLMNEDMKAFAAIKRSAGLLKGTWGDQLRGRVRIGFRVVVMFVLPSIALIVGGVLALGAEAPALGVPLLVLGAMGLALAALIGQTVQGVFATVLYLYASDHTVASGFSEDELRGAVMVGSAKRSAS